MSYALETKKRKFERILESLTDGSHIQPRASLGAKSNVRIIPSFGSDASKRRRITPVGKLQQNSNPSTTSLTTHYLPSSRLAFLERLESFRQVTKWHIPSTSAINAVAWAKRGWICQDTDTVSCPSCKERLHVDTDIEAHASSNSVEENSAEESEADDPLVLANAILQNLVERYKDMITTAHTEACPWRRRGCDDSIQRIEGLLNAMTTISSLEKRYESILSEDIETPQVMELPSSEQFKISEDEFGTFRFSDGAAGLDKNAMRLAICGWQKKEADIVECRNCFRSLGLWLYRGSHPTMEHLDAIDSHLEFCPWRSEAAQDTELTFANDRDQPLKQRLPGWTLVCLAIVKKNNKGKAPTWRDANQSLNDASDDDPQPQLTPEQREKKMKDLMKRIRDLKKPFNVKALLKKKDKSQLIPKK